MTVLLVLGAIVFGVIYMLATFVRPATRPMQTEVPLTKIGQ